MSGFQYLFRFKDDRGNVHYGEARKVVNSESDLVGKTVNVYSSDIPWDENIRLLERTATVAEVSCPNMTKSLATTHGDLSALRVQD
jgi:hypothetical protein